MFIVGKAVKNHEYLYKKSSTILCKSRKQATSLANFLNFNNETAVGQWKLKSNEVWWVYEIDKYDTPPTYKLKTTKGKIAVVSNN